MAEWQRWQLMPSRQSFSALTMHEAGSADPWCTSVPYFSPIWKCTAELLQFNHFQSGRAPPSGICSEVDFNYPRPPWSRSRIAPKQYLAKGMTELTITIQQIFPALCHEYLYSIYSPEMDQTVLSLG